MTLYYGVFDNSLALRDNDMQFSVASPGIAYMIEVKKTITDKLNEPFNNCDDNTKDLKTPLAKEIASRGSEYSQAVCYNLCRLHFMEKSCNCSLSYQLGLGGNDTCEGMDGNDTMRHACFNSKLPLFNYYDNCKSDCPLECDSVTFDLVKEQSKIVEVTYHIDFIKQYLNNSKKFSNYTLDSMKKQLIIFRINFGKMSFTKITEFPKKTFTDLVSDFGGIIGKIYKF